MQQQSHELIEENKRLNEIESKSFAKYNKVTLIFYVDIFYTNF